MFETFWISRRLEISCQVNGILFWLKRLPVLGKKLPSDLYDRVGLKKLVLALAILKELLSFFFSKLIYFGICIIPALLFFRQRNGVDPGAAFLHIFVCLTLAGAVATNEIVDSDDNSRYAVFLLGMDAKRYALANYLYFLIKTLIGFVVAVFVAFEMAVLLPEGVKLSRLWALLLPLLVLSCKLVYAGFYLVFFQKTDKLPEGAVTAFVMVLLFVAAYLPLLWGWTLPLRWVKLLAATELFLAVPAAVYLVRAGNYRRIYQRKSDLRISAGAAMEKTTKDKFQEKLELEASSDKQGCVYLNDLFMQRHRKLLRRPARRMALIMAGVLSALMIATQIFPEFSEKLRTNFMGVLPYLPMLMYFINRGETTTKILFFNCDSSLMAYSFYRSPQLIRSLFWERLRSLIRINLLPSTVLALGLPLLLLLAGGSDSPPDYLILPTSVLFLSVFFSTHYLVLYYLLQPYTQELVSKSPAYSTATLVTYWVCYFGANKMGKLISPTLLAAICIGVSLLYVLVALPLVSRLAPKTFRLRH